MAFESRFTQICCKRVGSPYRVGKEISRQTGTRVCLLRSASSRNGSMVPRNSCSTSKFSGESRIWPDSSWVTSKMSLTSCLRKRPESVSLPRAPRRRSGSFTFCSAISAKPRSALSGVRMSCAMRERKLVLAALARFASSAMTYQLRSRRIKSLVRRFAYRTWVTRPVLIALFDEKAADMPVAALRAVLERDAVGLGEAFGQGGEVAEFFRALGKFRRGHAVERVGQPRVGHAAGVISRRSASEPLMK